MPNQSELRDQELLAYRPHLSYEKIVLEQEEQETVETVDEVAHSLTLNELLLYAPCVVLPAIQAQASFVAQNRQNIEQTLRRQETEQFNFHEYLAVLKKPVITLDDFEFIVQFEKDQIESLDGNPGLEIYKEMVYAESFLNDIVTSFKKYAYHDQMTDEDIEKDKQLIKYLQKLESTGQKKKINYHLLAIDNQAGRFITETSQAIYDYALTLYVDYTLPDNALPLVAPLEPKELDLLFERLNRAYSLNENLTHRHNGNQLDALLRTLSEQRVSMLSVHDNKQSLEYAAQENSAIRSLMEAQASEVFVGLANCVKYSCACATALRDLMRVIQEKAVIRRIYHNLE